MIQIVQTLLYQCNGNHLRTDIQFMNPFRHVENEWFCEIEFQCLTMRRMVVIGEVVLILMESITHYSTCIKIGLGMKEWSRTNGI